MTQQASSPQQPDEALRGLPLIAAPPEIWAEVSRRTLAAPARRRTLVRVAIAAALLGAVAALLLLVTRDLPPQHRLAALIAQSQQAERRIASQSAMSGAAGDRAAVVYRIAELDRELGPLCVDPARDRKRAERLWRTRVELLEALAQIDRADARSVLEI